MPDVARITQGILKGESRSIARAITWIENDHPNAVPVLQRIFPHTGKAHIIGITGPPGAGKSTLTGQLTKQLRNLGLRCGLILVDPTSPFTGGAILGDRIRMPELSTDSGVYIRSMGTRGSLGGLALSTRDAIKVLDAAAFDAIIVETVGTGQAETDIVSTSDTVVVVTVPGLGDHIQTLKAGILEIADVFVVNKADKEGSKRTQVELEMMLDMGSATEVRPPVLLTTAVDGSGVSKLTEIVLAHYQHLKDSGELSDKRRGRYEIELRIMLENQLYQRIRALIGEKQFHTFVEELMLKSSDPYAIVKSLLTRFDLRKED